MYTETIVFDCPPASTDPSGSVLKMVAKWYSVGESTSNEAGFTLLFAHCVGAHKEQWEPTIEELIRLQRHKAPRERVREAWSFDWPSHGDAAVLNRAFIARNRDTGIAASEWAKAIAAFVRSRLQGKRLVVMGHSAACSAVMLSIKDIAVADIPYAAIVLIEPTFGTREEFNRHIAPSLPKAIEVISALRAQWPSRAAAHAWLQRLPQWKSWDARVLRIYTEYGLADTPDGKVEVKCDRRQEALAYADPTPHFAAVEELARVSHAIPIHLVYASRSHAVPRPVQDALPNAAANRVFASFTRLEGGHLLVQEDPDRVALMISTVLDSVGAQELLPNHKL
ncbi:Alpha/beta hydrolase fold-1 [Mycena belliarum]|uniref:Alpha/beta hydrolase fold-1 n=1 Tax=Mycena belliarum TaxID=1033014 RepID=A0AAD6U787_9AGAR|nr:Alpha/beta hydrolase fold-1 [Mycena belliae]